MELKTIKKRLLIVFYKNPILGKVKTRLAAAVGAESALAIYIRLANHTELVSRNLSCLKVVYYSDFIDTEDNWSNVQYAKELQTGTSLGERMHKAFEKEFSKGSNSVCIIGTDSFEITADILEEAFSALEVYDTVIGPAHDGGYYLLGMNKLYPEFFEQKQWSTNTVAKETIENFQSLELKYKILPILRDVDLIDDLPLSLMKLFQK